MLNLALNLAGLGGKIALLIIVPGIMLWASVSMFDSSLNYTVLEFYKTVKGQSGDTGLMSAIKSIWLMIRDISNILIIGAFVYIAISKILSISKDYRREIVTLLTVAILINFSFFFTLTAIDITNWMSVQTYNAMLPKDKAGNVQSIQNEGLADIIVTNMNGVEMTGELLSKTWDSLKKYIGSEELDTTTNTNDFASIVGQFTATLVLTLLASIMFFRMAFMFIARAILLFILLATSSFAFAAMLIPALNKYWISWRNGLLYNSLLAPILLLTLFMVTKLMEVMGPLKSSGSIAGGELTTGTLDSGFALVIVKFLIGIGLLWGAIRISTILSNKAADSMGAIGGRVNGLMNWAQRTVSRPAIASAGWAGRGTLGRGASYMSDRLGKWADSTNSARLSRGLNSLANSGALKSVANSSYDIRQNKNAQKFMEQAGINLGKGVTDGFKKIKEQREKYDKKHDEAQLKQVQEAIAEGSGVYNATKGAKTAAQKAQKDLEEQIKKQEAEMRKLEKQNKDDSTAQQAAQKTVEEKERKVTEIEERSKQASNTAQEAGALMAEETSKIKNIEAKLDSKSLELEKLRADGLSVGNADFDSLNKEIAELSKEKSDTQARIQTHSNTLQEAEKLKEEAQRTHDELSIAKANLSRIQEENKLKQLERDAQITAHKREIDELEKQHTNYQDQIQELDRTLKSYEQKWQETISKTRLAKAASSLSTTDRDWLEQLGIQFDKNNKVVSMPSADVIATMNPDSLNKLNKLLGQHTANLKFMSKQMQKAGMSKSDIAKQEEDAKVRKALLAALSSKDKNISDAVKEANKDATKEEK